MQQNAIFLQRDRSPPPPNPRLRNRWIALGGAPCRGFSGKMPVEQRTPCRCADEQSASPPAESRTGLHGRPPDRLRGLACLGPGGGAARPFQGLVGGRFGQGSPAQASDGESLWALVASLVAGGGSLSDLDALRSDSAGSGLQAACIRAASMRRMAGGSRWRRTSPPAARGDAHRPEGPKTPLPLAARPLRSGRGAPKRLPPTAPPPAAAQTDAKRHQPPTAESLLGD